MALFSKFWANVSNGRKKSRKLTYSRKLQMQTTLDYVGLMASVPKMRTPYECLFQCV